MPFAISWEERKHEDAANGGLVVRPYRCDYDIRRCSIGGGGVSTPPLSAERVAAFLDGRLSAEERAVVLAQLAADPDWREIAVDAAAVRDEVQGSVGDGVALRLGMPSTQATDAEPGSIRLLEERRTAGTRWMPWVALAAAACVTIFVLSRSEDTAIVNDYGARVAPVQALALGVSPDDARALTRERWRVVRAGTSSMDDVARAVRLGALSVDALLDREGQGAEARAEMVELLAPLNGAVARKLLTDARDSASLVPAFDAARGLVSQDAFDVGVWLELLRAGSESAPTAPGMIALLRRVADAKQLSPERAAELAALVRRLENEHRVGESAIESTAAGDVLAILAS